MICLTRLLAKQLRAAIRRTLQLQHSTLPHIVWVEGTALGLRVWSQNQHGAVEYRRAGTFPAERLPISVAVLAACEGTKATDTIELERQASGQVVVRWQDRGVPQSLTVESSETDCEPVPSSPTDWSDNSPGLVTALADAMEITDTSSSRWALSSIQLRGSGGRIAATDSTQMLVQNGFEFPWSEDVLVPRTTVFRQRDLWCDQRLRVGRTPEHVAFQSGPWTVWLAVHKDGRFPVVENIIPDAGSASTRMHIAEEDVDFLVNTVPRLPCDDSSHKPLTVDLNGHVALLARAADTSPVTRAVLSNGQRDGDELRWHTNRDYLLRAVQLGFREIELFGNEAPAVCRDAHRVYVWSLLPAADALVAGDNPLSWRRRCVLTRPRKQHPSSAQLRLRSFGQPRP